MIPEFDSAINYTYVPVHILSTPDILLPIMRIPTLTAVLALAYSVIAQEDVDLRQLTDGDFRASTARGLW